MKGDAMKVNTAISYRVYPTDEQKEMHAKTVGCCRKVHNLMLADKIDHYKATRTMLKVTPAAYKNDYPYLKGVDSLALANEQMNLQKSYQAFFSKQAGFPKFKSRKHTRMSYTTNHVNGNIRLEGKGIRLPKIGVVKTKLHRMPEPDWILKSATFTKEADGAYHISLLFEYVLDVKIKTPSYDRCIGLDYKSNGLYMDSEGNTGSEHHYFRKSEKKLARAQRRMSRKMHGSNNYEKAKCKVARIHKKIRNQRNDQLHKLSRKIADRYDVVCVEDLNMKGISNGKMKLGKATMDNGYGIFLSMLEYKMTRSGGLLVKIDKWFPSSQICSHCGHKQKLKLSDRIYVCPECGLIMDRDINAAINIKREGLRLLGIA